MKKVPLKCITQADIDKNQSEAIDNLTKVDEKHDKQFFVSMIVEMFYLIWLICLTAAMVIKK